MKRNGFTLVELLVVIVIIAALAGLSFAVLPRIQRKAKATASLSNLRQFAPTLTAYAGEHSLTLPPIKGLGKDSDGVEVELLWTEVCLQQINPDTAVAKFRDKRWWETTKPFAQNPLYKAWKPDAPGYAMNAMLAENVEAAKENGGATGDLLAVPVSLSVLSDPARTPLVAPGTLISYRYDTQAEINQFQQGSAKELLVEDKLPILFVDGHVESLTPKEYISRELYLMPRSQQ
ncbi:hypothetical protein GCM10023212_24200 [Luteolibacter yonseiensis]